VSYRIERVESEAAPAFAEAYAALAAEFAPRGELERREVVARWLSTPAAGAFESLERSYHLLVARDDKGAFAGVRDCHVVLDREGGLAVVYLAHVLVLPAYRRTGLGALLRQAPIDIARRAVGDAVDVVLAAEMEPASLDDESSLVRLTAYGRDGFAAIAPSALPYYQPDFRDLDAMPDTTSRRPIPLLPLVRFLGHEGATALPARLARAFVTHLYAVFATHVRPDHLAALQAFTLGVLGSKGEVPLLRLPRSVDDLTALRALTREAVLPFYSPTIASIQ